jgi:2-polyprenyl-3-methyl-5-hydroxy-6-metoxy-1,4-benzoquinol methylase
MCGAREWRDRLVARERQFGIAGTFTYASCAACGSLQLLDPPDDLSPYYPGEYYSLGPGAAAGLVARVKADAARYQVTGRGMLGRLVTRLARPSTATMASWLSRIDATPATRILDVGCGWGALLRTLDAAGYQRLMGVDPFLAEPGRVGRVELRRSTLEALADAPDAPRFDLVMIHHALEHVPEPRATLAAAHRVLDAGGHCLVRVPIVPSRAFARYGADWVQLDAPRHLVIPSERALIALAASVGLTLVDSAHDSEQIQLWGSELYARGITLTEGARTLGYLAKQRGRRFARRANAARQGDQAAFLFRAG